MLDESTLLDAHITLSETLRDTHYGHSIVIHHTPPSPFVFSRAVGNNTPFAIRGAAKHWPAIDPQSSKRWTNDYLGRKLGDTCVTVSLTATGFADSVSWVSKDGRRVEGEGVVLEQDGKDEEIYPNGQRPGNVGKGDFMFATPYDIQLPFRKVLSYMESFQASDSDSSPTRTIAFCQLQNDCLRGPEYSSLLADVPDAIPSWASAVLGTQPEAVNFWMGRHESVTSLHSDPYENLYTVVRGAKVFTLYPPCDLFFFHKQEYETAVWLPITASKKSTEQEMYNIPRVALVPATEVNGGSFLRVPWIPITHPHLPAPNHPRFAFAPKPFVVRIEAGDSLYLPRGWLHQVEQEEDEGGVCVAVNAWYEGWDGMGLAWAWAEYAKNMEEAATT